MCGIAGIYKFTGEPVLVSELKNMTDAIIHRGPDGEGQWVNVKANVGFGHRRLSIIDLTENGKQPMHYANGRYTITFNGEIYNYIEIKDTLLKQGYTFTSDSDTEVLLALYDQRKEKCLYELDGMFSFAIWDEKEQELFCARDRFGEKPFHYYFDGKQFVFASEIKQFWTIGITKELIAERAKTFLLYGQVDNPNDTPETFYKNIKRLDAAHYIKISSGDKQFVQKRYWDIDLSTPQFSGSVQKASALFYEMFKESVQLRLRSDVPVGSSLSGGLDSSSIVMIIDQLKNEGTKQNTFSARFKNFNKDEGTHIEKVVKACKNLNIHYTWPDRDYFEKVIDKVCFHQDEPFGSASIVAQYAVMDLAKQNNVVVLLDGQGADEILAGYLPYYRQYLSMLFYNDYPRYKEEIKAYNTIHAYSPITPFENSETLRMKLGRYKLNLLNQQKPVEKNALIKTLRHDTLSDGLKTLLRYADRNSMAHSREVRLPFLSHKLVEFVFSLPDEFKLSMGWTKFILRNSMKDVLPTEITWRVDKIGYEPPQKDWMSQLVKNVDVSEIAKAYGVNVKEIGDYGYTNDLHWKALALSKYI